MWVFTLWTEWIGINGMKFWMSTVCFEQDYSTSENVYISSSHRYSVFVVGFPLSGWGNSNKIPLWRKESLKTAIITTHEHSGWSFRQNKKREKVAPHLYSVYGVEHFVYGHYNLSCCTCSSQVSFACSDILHAACLHCHTRLRLRGFSGNKEACVLDLIFTQSVLV